MRILLIEDDTQISQVLVATLTQQNHVIDVAIDTEDGVLLLRNFPYELVLLDVVLPNQDGISFCRQLRQSNPDILIVLITAQQDLENRILGLDAGADDFLSKPFAPEELGARIRALQRRGSSSSTVLEFGELRLDPARRSVTYANQSITSRPKEYALIRLFLRHPNPFFSRRATLDRLWSVNADPPDESTIKAHVKGIRRVLRKVNAEDLIRTLYGQGYGLNLDYLQVETKAEKTQAIVADIWQQVKGLSFDRLAVLQQAVNQLKQSELSEILHSEALKNAHRLAGALGMFGFSEGSEIAKRLERLFESDEFDQSKIHQAEELTRYLTWYLTAKDQASESTKSHAEDLDSASSSDSAVPTSAIVLAIDDDVTVLHCLQALLKPFGVEIVSLDSADLLWQTLETVQPDLILLDVQMPRVTGLEVCQAIRTSDRWRWLPIIFLTICEDLDTQSRGFELGGDDYLVKPIVPSVLATRILNRIARFQTIQQHAIAALHSSQ